MPDRDLTTSGRQSRSRSSRFPGAGRVRLFWQLSRQLGWRECRDGYAADSLRSAAPPRRAFLRIALHGPHHVVGHERHRQDPGGDLEHAGRLASAELHPRSGCSTSLCSATGSCALVSLTVLPIVLVPTVRIGKRIRRTTRRAQDHAAELNEILQETIVGQQVVKAFGSEKHESAAFPCGCLAASSCESALRRPAGDRFTAYRVLGRALTIVGLLTYARDQIKAGASDHRRVHQFRDRAADAV